MCELNRTKVGDFNIYESVDINKLNGKQDIEKNIITIEKLFKNKPQIDIETKKLQCLLNGVQLTYKKPDNVYRIYNNNNFIGRGIIKNNLLKRDIVL